MLCLVLGQGRKTGSSLQNTRYLMLFSRVSPLATLTQVNNEDLGVGEPTTRYLPGRDGEIPALHAAATCWTGYTRFAYLIAK